ncbi:hypothetical protein K493DRAFT_361933 [Basidiobolus meristosporus CBS 931.73]|uniref:Extracellular membrane protein CFEM domain-containing protein n=1 Tax=Basidiobolus meristosporus CBS 931.73 TaxID=1314790 RepID=A0A1Y1X5U5_9FUNG|nr:hypothetical protein K493DRAFT_361933 [Basidiobolus meristosporus CBS 931.73]|eukprot:ORX81181.1 hypothetical protein K493DRAFT_361933 [Basidiobolus meristosporus CBS 931.73]
MKLNLTTLLLATALTSLASTRAEDRSCWRSCSGDATCLAQCDSQLQGIGDCKSKCNFSNPTQGRECIQACVQHHVLETPGAGGASQTPTPTSSTTGTAGQLHHTDSHGHTNCWRSCNGNSQCLDKCDQQVAGIGECKARCDFSSPAKGVECIKKCRDDHVFQSPSDNATGGTGAPTEKTTSSGDQSKSTNSAAVSPNTSSTLAIYSSLLAGCALLATLNVF